MAFVKKHLFLVLCAAAALVGVALLIMAILLQSANKGEFDKVKRQIDSVKTLTSKAVRDDKLEHYQDLVSRIRTQSENIELQARQTTGWNLIHPQVFPEPFAEPWLFYYRQFADRYLTLVQDFCNRLNAKDRPSDAEIRLQSDETSASRDTFGARDSSEKQKLSRNLFRQRAQEISIYANPWTFCCYEGWNSKDWENAAKETIFLDSWFTQVAAWIQEDVVQAIVQMNQASSSVEESPVKRLIEMSFAGKAFGVSGGRSSGTSLGRSVPTSVGSGRRTSDRSSAGNQLPAYVIVGGTRSGTGISGQIVDPWTRRTSGEIYDVVHFEITVIIDTTRINDFINALQGQRSTALDDPNENSTLRRNQITVLCCRILPFDNEDEQEAGYYYGPGSLALLQLPCEYVFFRKGYDHLKPQLVKDLFGGSSAVGSSGSRTSSRR